MIETLIQGDEAFELARDAVAAILAAETTSQQALATTAGEDPNAWRFSVYVERADPIERWLPAGPDPVPFVNVWWDSADLPEKNSSVSPTRENCTINIDCHAFAVSRDTPGGGHLPSDEAAAREVQRVARLVRQILDSGHYTYLGSPRPSADQWCYGSRVRRLQSFQPQLDAQNVGRVHGCRVTLEARLNMQTKQVLGDVLEVLNITARREPDGKVVARALIDNS